MIRIDITKQLQLAQGYTQLRVHAAIPAGGITAVYGASGAGKTTLLKVLAGLVQADEGTITVGNTVWLNTANRLSVPTQRRSIGFVFQDYALFPHMTVWQNLLYAAGKHKDAAYMQQLLQMVKMEAFAGVKPARLSGGQQQRVALIRALVRKPQLLLLDEPLSALDDAMRTQLRSELLMIQQQLQITTLLVTHDVGEIYSLASHIIHLEHGNIVFEGAPQQLFGAASLSSKLQIMGNVLQVIPNGVLYIVEVMAGSNIIRLTADAGEVANLRVGDTVLLFAKAFNVAFRKLQ